MKTNSKSSLELSAQVSSDSRRGKRTYGSCEREKEPEDLTAVEGWMPNNQSQESDE